MIERLGPNAARTVLGDAYNPDFRYELETADDGFHIIVIDPTEGTSTSLKLETDAPHPEKLKPLWKNMTMNTSSKLELLSRIFFWFFIAAAGASIALVAIFQV